MVQRWVGVLVVAVVEVAAAVVHFVGPFQGCLKRKNRINSI